MDVIRMVKAVTTKESCSDGYLLMARVHDENPWYWKPLATLSPHSVTSWTNTIKNHTVPGSAIIKMQPHCATRNLPSRSCMVSVHGWRRGLLRRVSFAKRLGILQNQGSSLSRRIIHSTTQWISRPSESSGPQTYPPQVGLKLQGSKVMIETGVFLKASVVLKMFQRISNNGKFKSMAKSLGVRDVGRHSLGEVLFIFIWCPRKKPIQCWNLWPRCTHSCCIIS